MYGKIKKGCFTITIKDIADLVGVSATTVSLVLNGKPGVGQMNRKKITTLLLENGYTIKNHEPETKPANSIVQIIRYADTGDLLDRNDDFVMQLIDGVESVLRQEQFLVSVTNVTDASFEDLISSVNTEENPLDNVAGIIFVGTEFDPAKYELLKSCPVPIVSLDNCFRGYPINAIDMDNIGGAQLSVQHLYEKGHRKVGYLRSLHLTESLRERRLGYLYAVDRFGLDLMTTIDLPLNVEKVDEMMTEYLDGDPDLPTAFFADNDVIAVGALRAFMRKGITVPKDISLIGFDDSQMASVVYPSLTTIHVPKKTIGICAANRLLALINKTDESITKTNVTVSLVERESVGIPK